MDNLPQSSSENESLHRVTSEAPAFQADQSFFQGNLNVQVRQKGNTNYVSWSTSAYNAYPYVTLTRQDTTNDTGLVTLLDHSFKYSPPYPDPINASVGDVYEYTVVLSNRVRVGPQETVDETISPVIEPIPIIFVPDSISPVEKQPVEHAPVEGIHVLPIADLPLAASDEQIQE